MTIDADTLFRLLRDRRIATPSSPRHGRPADAGGGGLQGLRPAQPTVAEQGA